MALHALFRATRVSSVQCMRRTISTSSPARTKPTRIVTRSTIAVLSLGLLAASTPVWLDAEVNSVLKVSSDANDERTGAKPSVGALIRAYVVYSMCSIPLLVDYSPTIISTLASIPGLKQLSEFIIKYTFFDQFVGGETVANTLPFISELRREGKGVLLAYSVEVDDDEKEAQNAAYKRNVEEMKRSIEIAGDFERSTQQATGYAGKTWVALKLTALLPSAESLAHFSTYLCQTRPSDRLQVPFPHTPHASDMDILTANLSSPPAPLTKKDIEDLRTLYADLRDLCFQAQEKGVCLIVDTEYTWSTPAIDALTLALSREFNRPLTPPSRSFFSFSSQPAAASTVQPLIFGTYQSYLRRGLPHLQSCLADAVREGYVLGVKLVRGAYQSQELVIHEKLGGKGTPPVWTVKSDTDKTYNESASFIVKSLKDAKLKGGVPAIGILFGTHNPESCEHILDGLVHHGLAAREGDKIRLSKDIAARLTFGQLMGMCDELTQYLVNHVISSSPVVLKYVPYGGLSEVIPYLARRAIENKSVLGGSGGASEERKVAWTALSQRLWARV